MRYFNEFSGLYDVALNFVSKNNLLHKANQLNLIDVVKSELANLSIEVIASACAKWFENKNTIAGGTFRAMLVEITSEHIAEDIINNKGLPDFGVTDFSYQNNSVHVANQLLLIDVVRNYIVKVPSIKIINVCANRLENSTTKSGENFRCVLIELITSNVVDDIITNNGLNNVVTTLSQAKTKYFINQVKVVQSESSQ
jgi:hypothetical protein